MKICITSTGPDMNSLVDPRFGRCQYFLIVNEKKELIKSMKNEGVRAMRGAGITAAQIIANEGVKVIITGNMGPNAFMVLGQSGIKIYLGAFDVSAKQALEMFYQDKLNLAEAPSGPGFHSGGGGFGPGGGYGQRRGGGGRGRGRGGGRRGGGGGGGRRR